MAETPLTSPQHRQWALEERAGHHPSSFVLIALWNQDLLCSIKTRGKSMSIMCTLAEMRKSKAWTPQLQYLCPQGESHCRAENSLPCQLILRAGSRSPQQTVAGVVCTQGFCFEGPLWGIYFKPWGTRLQASFKYFLFLMAAKKKRGAKHKDLQNQWLE